MAEIACSLDATSAADRMRRWEALSDLALKESGRTGKAAWQRYRYGVSIERELRELIELEGLCCPFLDFRLERRDGALQLEISGPADAEGIIDAFAGSSDR